MDYTFIHCLFEQTHTFADAIIRDGRSSALCYDIDGNPDVKCDIFMEIDKWINGLPSLFDNIAETDLVLAFFPCTYFSGFNKPMLSMTAQISQFEKFTPVQRAQCIARRAGNFAVYYGYICKLIAIAQTVGFHLIIENPAHTSFLRDFTPCDTFFIDYDRRRHGDEFAKPTYFFFINKPLPLDCNNDNSFKVDKSGRGICDIRGMLERSTITPAYADWFVKNIIYSPETYEISLF